MKTFLNIDKTPPALERSFKAATKLRCELPTDIKMESILLMELPSLAEDIHDKTQDVSQNTTLDMREFLGINEALQAIQSELAINASKLLEINERMKKIAKS